MIEVEVRSFISEEQYLQLLDFFKSNAELVKEDDQESFYFDGDQDLRIQKNNSHAKIWLKKGKLHDDHREEIEIPTKKENFNALEQLFLTLGYNVNIKWFRKRNQFRWDNITVCLDYTKGYGYIIELEQLTEENENTIHKQLVNKLKELNIPLTPKEEFDKQFNYYKENWKSLIN